MTLHDFINDVLDRLGDLDNDIWTRDEVALYVKDGYNLFTRRTKTLFDIHVIENVPKSGNWQTDLERYLAEQHPGWGLTDEPLHMTAEHERSLGVGRSRDTAGTYAVSPKNLTSPSEQQYVGVSGGPGEDIPTTVPGGLLPKSVVEVLRVAYDQQDLTGIGSQQMRQLDPNYETRSGDPKWFIYDKDGLFYLRVVPAAQGDAAYDNVNGGFGTLTQLLNTQAASLEDALVAYWSMEETAYPVTDSIGSNDIVVTSGTDPSAVTGKNNSGLSWGEAGTKVGDTTIALPLTGAFGISLWFYTPSTAGSWPVVNGDSTSFVDYVAASDTLTHTSGAVGSATLSAGAWHHIVYNYDGAGTVTVYVNGELDITTSYTHATEEKLRFQYATWDEYGFFNRELTADEVALLYNEGSGVFYPGMGGVDDTVVATETSGATTGGYGILRSRDDSNGWFPAGGPYGTPTQVHPDYLNIKVEMTRLGRDLKSHVSELPSAYNKYVVYWAMHRALKRSGPGQDIELAEHYGQRFELGVDRMIKKRDSMQPEREGRFGGGAGDGADFALGLPLLPSAYEYPWR